MIIVGKVKELDKVKDYSSEIKEKIREQVEILDNCYGENRDLKKDLGGYIAIIQSKKDIEVLKQEHLDIYKDIAEFQIVLQEDVKEKWLYVLFTLSSDYVIGIIGSNQVLEEEKIQVE